MPLFILPINYFLLFCFLYEYYIVYFVSLFFFFYILEKIQFKQYTFLSSIILFFLSPFLFEYFDDAIFEVYLFFEADRLYHFIGGEVSYILALLHSFFFLFEL